MRWIKELFNPILKCQRIGHQHSTETVDGYARPPSDDRRNSQDVKTITASPITWR